MTNLYSKSSIDEIQEGKTTLVQILNKVADLKDNPSYFTDEIITLFMKGIFNYARIRRYPHPEEEEKVFIEQFPELINALERYLFSAIDNLDCENPVIQKSYKSAITFLREDIFDVYKNSTPLKDTVDKVRKQLESLKSEEKYLHNPYNGGYSIPDLEGVPIAHYWWRDSISRRSPEKIQELRKLFLEFLSGIAELSGDSRYYTNECVSDFMWTIFEYVRAWKFLKVNEPELWDDEEKAVIVNMFPNSLENLKKYLLSAIQNLEKENPISNKVYKSALAFLCKDILNIYTKFNPSKDSLINVEKQLLSLKDNEKYLPELKNGKYHLPGLKGVPDTHGWWRDKYDHKPITHPETRKSKRKYAIGIDLGTTNCAVAVWEQEKVEFVENNVGSRLTPSYAYYSPQENCIGKMAFDQSGIDPQNVLFDAKRLLAQTIDSQMIEDFQHIWPFKVTDDPGSKNSKAYFASVHEREKKLIPPEKVSSDILKSLLNDVCKKLNATKDDIGAVITVPAYFNMDQKRATMEAAKAAGIHVEQILSEPVAAALAYQQELAKENRLKERDSVFIFDLGGGTFDVTIMKVEDSIYKVIALGGDTHLGGRDFDRVIAKMIEEQLRNQLEVDKVNKLMDEPKNRYKIMEIATEARESFTQTESETILLNGIHPDAKDKEITRKEFEKESRYLQDKIKKCCIDTLNHAKKANIDPKHINHVLLVGGASKMKLVEKIMKDIFPEKTLLKTVSGDEAIAKGATVYAAKLLGVSEDPVIKNLKIQDALPLSIGIEDKESKFKVILEHNSPLPVDHTIEWRTTEDDQPCIKIPIHEGLSEKIKENTYVGEIEIENIPPGKAGKTIDVTFRIDENGFLQAKSKIHNTNVPVPTEFKSEKCIECVLAKGG